MRSGASFGFLVIGAVACLAACARDTFPRAPIVLISIDTLRSDHLPAYGYRGLTTPAIDRLRTDGILFSRAYSHTPLTLPSHASILSGLLPTQHGVRDNVGYAFDGRAHKTLASRLAEAGYATGAAVSSFVLRHDTGVAAGFAVYDDAIEYSGHPGIGEIQRPGGESARALLSWIGAHAGQPFFAFLHLYEPHAPYTPPEPYRSRYADRPYDGEIAAADAVVGELLDDLRRRGLYDRALIVLLADHGEGLGEHGERQHGIFLYRSTLQVPLLVKLPANRHAGETRADPVGLADVAPTLLELVGLRRSPEMLGPSLLAAPTAERHVYSESFYARLHLGWSDLQSLVDARFHYVDGPRPELFALDADPGETRNVLAEQRPAFNALRTALAAYPRTLAPPGAADPEVARRMAALGYLGGVPGDSRGELPDPRAERPTLALIETATDALAVGRFADAVVTLERLLAANPAMTDMWGHLGEALSALGRREEAARAFDEAMELSGGLASPALAAGECQLALHRYAAATERARIAERGNPELAQDLLARIALASGDRAAAKDLMARAIASGQATPRLRRLYAQALADDGDVARAIEVLAAMRATADPETLRTLAGLLADAGRAPEADAIVRELLAANDRDARAHELAGTTALRSDRLDEARRELERAVALDPSAATAWNTLGVAAYRAGDGAAATAAWRRSLALDAQQYDALFNLGLAGLALAQTAAQADGGRAVRLEAADALRRFVAAAPPARFAGDIATARQALREIGQ